MQHQRFTFYVCLVFFTFYATGCVTLDEGETGANDSMTKTRWSANVGGPFPVAQDLAILLPRSEAHTIRANTAISDGLSLLPEGWLTAVTEAFYATPVETALDDENWYEDWQIASIRIAPCAALVNVINEAVSELCWPEVRVVWQPTLFEFSIRGVIRAAYSDDRAIHALYHFLPERDAEASQRLISQVKSGNTSQLNRFLEARNEAVEQLLSQVAQLRTLPAENYSELWYRAELLGNSDSADRFIDRLTTWLRSVVHPSNAHTVTAFSLPTGRQPAGIDLWSFIAFNVDDGLLSQKHLEIIDPLSGEVLGVLQNDETVASGNADPRLTEQMDDPRTGSSLAHQVLTSVDQRTGEFADRINNPSQTLVPNTSCATCHSLNELVFDMHNLSYLENNEITVSERVKADVAHELKWIEAFISQTTPY
ncbi:MAG: hypothetical protein ACPGQS_12490 [Bradymonadia bacterium]